MPNTHVHNVNTLWYEEWVHLPVYFEDDFGTPVIGVTWNQVTCKYARETDVLLQVYPITAPNWIDLGEGWYWLYFNGALLNVLGQFDYQVKGYGGLYPATIVWLAVTSIDKRPEVRVLDALLSAFNTPGTIGAAINEIPTIEIDVGALTTDVGNVQTDVSGIIVTLGGVVTTVGNIETTVNLVDGKVDALATSVNTVNGNVLLVGSAVGNVQTTVNAIQVTVNNTASDVTDLVAVKDKYEAFCSVCYDRATATLTMLAWMHKNGAIVTNPALCNVVIRDSGAGQIVNETSVNPPNAEGVFTIVKTGITLPANHNYQVRATVRDAGLVDHPSNGAMVSFN